MRIHLTLAAALAFFGVGAANANDGGTNGLEVLGIAPGVNLTAGQSLEFSFEGAGLQPFLDALPNDFSIHYFSATSDYNRDPEAFKKLTIYSGAYAIDFFCQRKDFTSGNWITPLCSLKIYPMPRSEREFANIKRWYGGPTTNASYISGTEFYITRGGRSNSSIATFYGQNASLFANLLTPNFNNTKRELVIAGQAHGGAMAMTLSCQNGTRKRPNGQTYVGPLCAITLR
ncbi:MAG: hypothetical protein HY078_16320 [Elusimicrobia bacterium]|nr:hypothetical protein [Elusimicrobiota bacterium]